MELRDAANPYTTAHDHVRAVRGRPANLTCEECGHPAQDWALIPGREKLFWRGWFSDDVHDYRPLCEACHAVETYDGKD